MHGIATMCRVLDVTRSGFYLWLRRPLSDRAIEDLRLLALFRASYAASGGVYGSPRVFLDLREAGERCGRHRVARIMRSRKIKTLRGYKAPRSIDGRPSIIAPNTLQRQFTVAKPDQVWVTDMPLIRKVIEEQWAELSDDSPNQTLEQSSTTLYTVTKENTRDMEIVLCLVLDATSKSAPT